MEILLNELSLTGQFKDEDDFFDNLDSILEIIKIIDKLEFSLLKEYNFFQSKVTTEFKLDIFLRLRTDKARKLKQFLLKLAYNPPYWNENQKHNCPDNSYIYNLNNICNTSIAESCERDKIVISFNHSDFSNINLEVQKNSATVNIYNLIDKHHFLEYLLSISKIEPLNYCQFKFKDSNLNFSKIEEEYGFDSLKTLQQKNEFLNAFNGFYKMSWEEISNSDGLEYKKYNKPKKKKIKGWFRQGLYKNTDIYKFRITQEYRCFGYREKDEFFVLRFEIGHEISDNG